MWSTWCNRITLNKWEGQNISTVTFLNNALHYDSTSHYDLSYKHTLYYVMFSATTVFMSTHTAIGVVPIQPKGQFLCLHADNSCGWRRYVFRLSVCLSVHTSIPCLWTHYLKNALKEFPKILAQMSNWTKGSTDLILVIKVRMYLYIKCFNSY